MALGTTNITVGTQAIQVLGPDDRRKYAVVTNENGVGELYLAIGTNAVRAGGIPLISKGSSFEITKDNFVTAKVSAIGTTDGVILAISSY